MPKVESQLSRISANREENQPDKDEHKRGRLPNTKTLRQFCGATYLFDEIVNQLGLRDDSFTHKHRTRDER